MRTITLEEHFVTQSFLKATGSDRHTEPFMARLLPRLLDLGAGRIAAMDEAGIDLQVLSLAALDLEKIPAASASSVLRDINDELAVAVRANPTRLAAFATLNLEDPAAAAAELERCVSTFGFRGAMLNGTVTLGNRPGVFLDDPRFTPVFEAAAALGVPIYLHPAVPPEPVKEVYFAGLPHDLAQSLSIAGWGWHAETGLHTLRLITSGLFDRLPRLQLIIGHMGEGLPYALARSSGILSNAAPGLKHSVDHYFQSNIHITSSGYFTHPPLKCCLDVVGLDRMLFSIDYPFSPNKKGRDYLESLTSVLPPDDLARFAHGNAEKLLRLP